MPDLPRILNARAPLTLASVARGAQPLVMADLARASAHVNQGGRAVFVAPDDAALNALAEVARYFAPELEVLEYPAWDCLPYDRASPALSVSARRLAALQRLQAGPKEKDSAPQLLVTTVNALLQRALTPFRIREAVREFKPGTLLLTCGNGSKAEFTWTRTGDSLQLAGMLGSEKITVHAEYFPRTKYPLYAMPFRWMVDR